METMRNMEEREEGAPPRHIFRLFMPSRVGWAVGIKIPKISWVGQPLTYLPG